MNKSKKGSVFICLLITEPGWYSHPMLSYACICPCVRVNPYTTVSLKSHLLLEGQVIKVYFNWPTTHCTLGSLQ